MKLKSSSSTHPHDGRLPWQTWLILTLATVVSMGSYLLASAIVYRIGFPLDDSWIHQTYARNLALRGEWAFIPGQSSGGSTSPLWSTLLAIGFRLILSPYWWTYFLGGVLLLSLAVQIELGTRALVEGYRGPIPWAGLLVVFEWHMVWSAASGMETLLHALVILVVLLALTGKPPRWLALGMLAGLSVWIRPDGLTLLGPIVFTALLGETTWKSRLRALFSALLGFGLLYAFYLLFNLTTAGTVMPNTFYAKQAEYASWQARPILDRAGELLLRFLTGPAIILLPGFMLSVKYAFQQRKWGQISAVLWVLGYLGLYLLRLPAYQHGRYIMPAMPVYFALGLAGYYSFVLQQQLKNRMAWLLKTGWSLTLILVSLSFWALGLRSYVEDVRFVESEMVDSAKWVSQNIPAGKLVATHDIGAMGYFGNHDLVDLAGLVSPEVIPFIRDEVKLADYLDARHADYLVAFPDWYRTLTSGLTPVFTTGAPETLALGETNMTVYQWPDP